MTLYGILSFLQNDTLGISWYFYINWETDVVCIYISRHTFALIAILSAESTSGTY